MFTSWENHNHFIKDLCIYLSSKQIILFVYYIIFSEILGTAGYVSDTQVSPEIRPSPQGLGTGLPRWQRRVHQTKGVRLTVWNGKNSFDSLEAYHPIRIYVVWYLTEEYAANTYSLYNFHHLYFIICLSPILITCSLQFSYPALIKSNRYQRRI